MLRHLQRSIKRVDSDEELFSTSQSLYHRGSMMDDMLYAPPANKYNHGRNGGGGSRQYGGSSSRRGSSSSSPYRNMKCLQLGEPQKYVLATCAVVVLLFLAFENHYAAHDVNRQQMNDYSSPTLRRDTEVMRKQRSSGNPLSLPLPDDEGNDLPTPIMPLPHKDPPSKKLKIAVRPQQQQQAEELEDLPVVEEDIQAEIIPARLEAKPDPITEANEPEMEEEEVPQDEPPIEEEDEPPQPQIRFDVPIEQDQAQELSYQPPPEIEQPAVAAEEARPNEPVMEDIPPVEEPSPEIDETTPIQQIRFVPVDESDFAPQEQQIQPNPEIIEQPLPPQPLTTTSHLNFHATHPTAPTIAYVIPILSCQSSVTMPQDGSPPPRDDATLYDGAAVLAHSIKRNSIHNPSSGSRYGHHLVAIFHPDAVLCHGENRTTLLQSLGYEVLIRDVPVPLNQIQGEYLRANVHNNGVDGLLDHVKLHVYTLTNYPIAVLLDIKSLILQPLDELFNLFSFSGHDLARAYNGTVIPIAKNFVGQSPAEGGLQALYTKAYNSMVPRKWTVGINTAFVILRPNVDVFRDMTAVIRRGDFRPGSGWAGMGEDGVGDFYGAMQTRGLMLHYYTNLLPGSSIELDRCVFNNVGDVPYIRLEGTKTCRDTRLEMMGDNCRDCRETPIERIRSVNYSVCREPWGCRKFGIRTGMCETLHQVWHEMRAELKVERGCVDVGHDGYLKLERPGSEELRGI